MPSPRSVFSPHPEKARLPLSALEVLGCAGAITDWNPDGDPVDAARVHHLGVVAELFANKDSLVQTPPTEETLSRTIGLMASGGVINLVKKGHTEFRLKEGSAGLFVAQLDPSKPARAALMHRTSRFLAEELRKQFYREQAAGKKPASAREAVIQLATHLPDLHFLR